MTVSERVAAVPIEVRTLNEHDAEAYWHLRLEALETELEAFAESAAEHRRSPLAITEQRLGGSSPDSSFVVGAFGGGQLLGMAGFYRFQGEKTRHKGRIFGVYVKPEYRGQGIARRIMTELLNRLRSAPGLQQVDLTIATTQHAARKLYLSFGFVTYGREPRAVMNGDAFVDEDLMVLKLG
jgi:ribosomal protein S18 acetylase RimI-like enzyme